MLFFVCYSIYFLLFHKMFNLSYFYIELTFNNKVNLKSFLYRFTNFNSNNQVNNEIINNE